MKTLLHPSSATSTAMFGWRQFLAFLPLAIVLLTGMPSFGESSGLKTAPVAAAPSKPVLFKGGRS
jgi:hypothetical protein